MPSPMYNADDFVGALKALMPRGRIWPRTPDANLNKFLAALSPTFVRNTEASINLLTDAFPSTALNLLPAWEDSLGLPDPCAGETPTLQGRRGQVVARFAGTGGESAQYYTTYAANLGYQITVLEYTPFRMGQQRMGMQLGGPDWANTWSANAQLNTFTSFRMGQSGMGEPLESWGNTVLQCELNAIKPAHTVLLYTNYGRLDSTAVLGNFTLA